MKVDLSVFELTVVLESIQKAIQCEEQHPGKSKLSPAEKAARTMARRRLVARLGDPHLPSMET